MKVCKKCNIEKDEQEFNKWYKKTGTWGYRSSCRVCEHIENKKYREEKKSDLTLKRRERTGAKPKIYCTDPKRQKRNEEIYRSERKYPEKKGARIILNSYVKTGKIIKPEKCEMCLKKIKLEAHHDDYSKPLEVKWLCKRCHTDIHWKNNLVV